MSIVYDYLKKIHDQKEPQKVVPVVAASPVKKNSGSRLGLKIVVGILVCLLLGAGLYYLIPLAGKSVVKPLPAPPRLPAVPQQTSDFNFMLEGIIYNPSRPFAIFNGKMLEVGGQVGDFEVVKITPDTVQLKNLKDGTPRTARL
jgi:hypothetical protein